MSKFIEALEKTTPSPAPAKTSSPDQIKGLTTQDMKDYFEAMKESLLSDLRKEMQEIQGKQSGSEKSEPEDKPDPEQIKEKEEEK